MTLAALAAGALVPLMRGEPLQDVLRRDSRRLADWLEFSLARADRWEKSFVLVLTPPPADSADAPFAVITWDGSRTALQEKFTADRRVRWILKSGSRTCRWNWRTHSMSPAFSLAFRGEDGTPCSAGLTLSLRGLLTLSE